MDSLQQGRVSSADRSVWAMKSNKQPGPSLSVGSRDSATWEGAVRIFALRMTGRADVTSVMRQMQVQHLCRAQRDTRTLQNCLSTFLRNIYVHLLFLNLAWRLRRKELLYIHNERHDLDKSLTCIRIQFTAQGGPHVRSTRQKRRFNVKAAL